MRRLLGVGVVVAALALIGCEPAHLVGAGDIASCSESADTATGQLLAEKRGEAFAPGDMAYDRGSLAEYQNCYQPVWGHANGRMHPSPGNHEYGTSGAAGYFDYWAERAGPRGNGYYHFDVGSFTRVFSLNSETNISDAAQYVRDVGNGGRACVFAYWHKPLKSSGEHGNISSSLPLWQAVFDIGGDLVLNGHDHNYERFGGLDRNGAPVSGERMREIVVGTGGKELRGFNSPVPGSQVRASVFGLIDVDIESNQDVYEWHFESTNSSFTDSGFDSCHGNN